METIRWPNLEARLRDRAIRGVRYQGGGGFLVLELGRGLELWLSADTEGCQMLFNGVSHADPMVYLFQTWRPRLKGG